MNDSMMLGGRKFEPHSFANIGTDEAFVRELLEVVEILEGSLIVGEQRQNSKHCIITIMSDGLMPTFLKLREIRESQTKNMPVVDRLQLYEDFARKIWKAYKDLTQRAIKVMGLGIGFLFEEEKKFEEGLKKFRDDWPALQPGFEKFVRENRNEWQNELATFRNTFVEHQTGDRMDFKKFYDANYVESLFEKVWGTIVDLLVIVLSLKLPARVHVVVNDEKIHGPWPRRFRWIIEGLR